MNDVQIEYLNLYRLLKAAAGEYVQFTAIANFKVASYLPIM